MDHSKLMVIVKIIQDKFDILLQNDPTKMKAKSASNVIENLKEKSFKFVVPTGWKKFSRVGTLNQNVSSFTDCNSRQPVSVLGLNVVQGIIYIDDPSQLINETLCLGSSIISIDNKKTNSHQCKSNRWCSEFENEKLCESSCHSVTGNQVAI